MKNTLLTIVLAALCLNFGNNAQAQVQPETNKAIDITTKGIQLGQKIPDIPSLSKYKGKLIILDFWATWCSPCVAMIPKMEALQTQFNDQIQIIPVTYQSEQETTTFLNKLNKGKESKLPQITGDKELQRLFPHVYLPHYIWIDAQGIVKAITGHQEITANNIQKMLADGSPQLAQKRDKKIAYDKKKPLLVNGNGGDGSGIFYHTVFSNYIAGIRPGFDIKKDSVSFTILARNQSMVKLFKLAMGEGKQNFSLSKTKLDVLDATVLTSDKEGQEFSDWLKGHGYCYEITVPLHLKEEAYQIMQKDLIRFFDRYKVSIEKRTTKCLSLVRISSTDLLKTKGGKQEISFNGLGCRLRNAGLSYLIAKLDWAYLQNYPLPIVNATGYKGMVDIDLNANLSDIPMMNRELERYGLSFEERNAEIQMLVIKDAQKL